MDETEDGVTLYFKDGTTVTADAVIGADGVHSKVREILIGADAAKLVFTGAVVYRGLVPMEKGVEVLGSEHAQNSTVLCGPGKLLRTDPEIGRSDIEIGHMTVSYPIDSGKTLNIAAFNFGLEKWPHEKWIVPANYEELVKSFEGWGKPAQGLMKVSCPRRNHLWLPL